jgi:hypothetical protein
MPNPKKLIDTDDLFSFIEKRPRTTQECCKKFRQATVSQIEYRLGILRRQKRIHAKKFELTSRWYVGEGGAKNIRKYEKMPKPKNPVNYDLSGLSQPLRYFGGYV